MRFLIVYSVLVAFSFLSLTPAGVSLAELRADDDLELDELDLGLEDDEESGGKKAKKDDSEDEEDEDAKDSEKDEEESEEKSSEDSEDEEDDEGFSSSKKSAKVEEEEDTYAATGTKIAAFYFFEDSHALKSASHVVAETARQLESSSDYDYVGTEASFFSTPVAADMKKAKKDFDAGVAQYADYNHDEAIEKFQSALKYFEKNLDKAVDMKFLSEIIFYLGASHKQLDEDKRAETYFANYISINPDGQPDESKFSSEIISAFNDVKKSKSKAFKGAVRVSSNPDGALVFIDGKIAGVTPVILRGITEGKHYYRIHKNGYRDAGGTVEVKGGRSASISETITKYSQASSMFEAEKEMKSEFGQVSMLSKAVEIARELDVDSVLVVDAKIGSDEKLNYTGYMVNMGKREYKKTEAVFRIPEKGKESKQADLKEFNNSLINDPYEYKSISEAFAAEVALLASDGSDDVDTAKKKDKDKKPVYKEWWLWTIVGVVAAAGVVLAVDAATGNGIDFFGATGGSGDSKGGTLKINFE